MLYASRLWTTSTRNLTLHAIISQIGPTRRVDALLHYRNIGVKCLCPGYNDTLPSSGTEPTVKNLAIANLRSYSLSCTAALVSILALSVFPKYRTSNFAITKVWFTQTTTAS